MLLALILIFCAVFLLAYATMGTFVRDEAAYSAMRRRRSGFLLAITLMAEAALSAALAWFGAGHAWYGALAGAVDLLLVNAASAALFALLLARLAPRQGIRWRDALPAAAVITGLFAVGRYLIALYLARTGVASAYGAAGSLAAILVWIYWSAQIFLFGACVLRVQQPDAGPA